MNRIANCSCGDLELELSGDPVLVAVCNCKRCQKRSGSAFGTSAYFKDHQVNATGKGKVFTDNSSDSGKVIDCIFCGKCGSTLYWRTTLGKGLIGVAVGCIEDQDFPEPTTAAWCQSKLGWVSFPNHWVCLPKQDLPEN